jgi:hypothetical protein
VSVPFRLLWQKAIVASALSATQRHVALTLALHMDAEGGSCWPSVQTLAAETGLSDRAVQKALAALGAAGFVAIDRLGGRRPGGGYVSNRYLATLPEGVNEVHPSRARGVNVATSRGERGSGETPIGDSPGPAPDGERAVRGERLQPFLGAKQRATRTGATVDAQRQHRVAEEAERWWASVEGAIAPFGLDESDVALLREGCARNRDVGNLLIGWAHRAANPRADLLRRLEETRANEWRIPAGMDRPSATGWGVEVGP